MRKAPFPIALVLLLTAVSFTLLSTLLPSLIHVVQPAPGPLHHEVKYGLYRRCVRRIPESDLLLLERTHPSDISLPSNLDRLNALTGRRSVSNATTARSILDGEDSLRVRAAPGPGDIPIGEGDGWTCQPFPQSSECKTLGQGFCIMWATAGYAAQLSLFPCLVSLITLLLITIGVGSKKTRAQRRRGGWKIVSGLMSIHSVLQIVAIAIILHVYRTDVRFSVGSHLDTAADLGVASALISIAIVIALTWVGLAAQAGKEWAGGKPPRRRRHRRTRSGRVVTVPNLSEDEEAEADEETGLLNGPAGVNGAEAATGHGGGVQPAR